MLIPRCYDSHVHFSATGWLQSSLNLKTVSSFIELKEADLQAHYFRGPWLVGFGWDENNFRDPSEVFSNQLSQLNLPFPIALTRTDGHSMLVNDVALNFAKQKPDLYSFLMQSPLAHKDSAGQLTGLLREEAKFAVDSLIPAYSDEQEIQFLLAAQDYFFSRGFTHVRDMSGSKAQSQRLLSLEHQGKLKMFIESNYTLERVSDLEKNLRDLEEDKKIASSKIRVLGTKIYFDGSLGSETALLSKAYAQRPSHQGVRLWPISEVEEVLRQSWQEGLPVAVHAIGDQGAHEIVECAHGLYQSGVRGILNLEHGEMLRPETIQLMKEIQCVVHMQPCHYLSDRKWLQEKLGPLKQYAFPWAQLEEAGIKIQFGSDSPIEEPSILANLQALELASQEGIRKIERSFSGYHSHPDQKWGPDFQSEFTPKGEFLRIIPPALLSEY